MERLSQLQADLTKFINHVDELTDEDDPAGNGFHREYRYLREKGAEHKENNTFPSTIGREPYNMKKNRYKDIIAYDYTRVELQDTGVEGSDYINANLIQNPHDHDGYIASQGPLTHTVGDFWRMIMEYRVKVVIMACKLVEGNKKKCAMYWPETVGEEEDYGSVTVKMTNEKDMKEDCTVRVMEASDDDHSQTVTQYHYTGWPDHGIPEDREVILAMVAKMREIHQNDEDRAPILVHCSAGCGRTGTVCAIDYAWEILKSGKMSRKFSMKEIVESMREQRQSMIQTPDQYEMAHLAVRDLFQKHLEIMEENVYMNFGDHMDEQDALDDLDTATTAKDEEDIHSFASAKKTLQVCCVDIVNIYGNEDEISNDNDIGMEKQPPKKPDLPKDKPKLKLKDPQEVHEDTKPAIKHKYENVAGPASYENMDLVEEKQGISSDKKVSPKITKKPTPPPSPIKQQNSPSVYSEPQGLVFKKPESPVSVTGKKDSPKLDRKGMDSTGKKKDSPVIERKVMDGTGKKKDSPVIERKVMDGTGKKKDSPVIERKVMNSAVEAKDTSDDSCYSMASPASAGPTFVPSKVASQSGPTWSAPKLATTEPPKGQSLVPKPAQNVKTVSSADPQNKKHVTKIQIGSGTIAPVSSNKAIPESNNNMYSLASGSKDQKSSGPAFASSSEGDMYSVVQKDSKTSTLRSSQGHSNQTPAPQQSVYSQVKLTPEAEFKGHILGGDGSYAEVVIGQPAKVEDSAYSYVSVDPSSQDVTPQIPKRGYLEPSREPSPRGPAETHNATLSRVGEQGQFKKIITKIKGGPSEHQYADTSHIKGFHERIGQKPMGKKEEPSRWKKIFK